MQQNGITVLSLFDGMSCLQIALIELGMKPQKYYASEIDQHAIKQTQLNFPDTIQLGSVTEWKTWDIDWSKVSLIGAGSPCQGFSFAGKQLAFDDPRSVLFFVFIDILNHCRKFNPNVKFLLENVDMKREHMKVINDSCGLFPVNINSNLVSAQNRNRWYWSNIRTKQVGLFGEIHTDIPQPKDRGILLKDILEKEVPEKYYLSGKALEYLDRAKNERIENVKYNNGDSKTSCITANYMRGVQNSGETYVKLDKQLNPKANQDKASCFTAGGNSGGNHSDMDLICVTMRGRNPDNPSDRRAGSPTEQRLEPNLSGKTNCLTSVQKDNLVMQLKSINNRVEGVSFNEEGVRPHQGDYRKSGIQELGTIATENSKTSCLTTNHEPKCILNERQQNNFKDGNEKANTFLSTSWKGSQANGMTLIGETRIRRLTPTECARLQTIPEWYKWGCSDTQQYRMLGNGWTVQVIAHILSFLQ